MSKIPPSQKRKNEGRTAADSGRSLGAGSEAAQGIHGARLAANSQGERTSRGRRSGGSAPRSGSEPLHHRSIEHKSGYGGEGGQPRTSSDERQHFGIESHPALRELFDKARSLSLDDRLTLLRGLIPSVAGEMTPRDFEAFAQDIRMKGEMFYDAKQHPRQGKGKRHVMGERDLDGRGT